MAPATMTTSGQLPTPAHCRPTRPPPRHRPRQTTATRPSAIARSPRTTTQILSPPTAVTSNYDHQVSPCAISISLSPSEHRDRTPLPQPQQHRRPVASYQRPPIATPLAHRHVTVLDKPQRPNDDDPSPSAIAT